MQVPLLNLMDGVIPSVAVEHGVNIFVLKFVNCILVIPNDFSVVQEILVLVEQAFKMS